MTDQHLTQSGLSSAGSPLPRWLMHAVALLIPLGVIIALTLWATVPDDAPLVVFVIGAAILIGVTAGFAALGWHLLYRPLPSGHRTRVESVLKPRHRQVLGALLTITSLNLIVGGV